MKEVLYIHIHLPCCINHKAWMFVYKHGLKIIHKLFRFTTKELTFLYG